jgi:hypothetical protein
MTAITQDLYTVPLGVVTAYCGRYSSAPEPSPLQLPGQYRSAMAMLFQPAAAPTYPARVPGGSAYEADVTGPTRSFVDPKSGFAWVNDGGDILDAALVRQGTTPWFTFPANSVPSTGDGATFRYTGINITQLAKYVFSSGRPFAIRLTATAPRKVAGLATPGQLPPVVTVTYQDGSSEQLPCRLVADTSGSGLVPNTFLPATSMPCFVEFDRPRRLVGTASLDITLNAHFTGSGNVSGMLLAPASAESPYTGGTGLAVAAGSYDAGLAAVPGIIGQHRYQDGSTLTDWVVPGAQTISGEVYYDPALWGGTPDLTKLPHAGLGKWINPPTTPGAIQLVSSSYTGEGFEPLAPGLGAIRLRMAPSTTVDGSTHPPDEGPLANMMLFMPPDLFGVLSEICVRYYFRLGAPYNLTPADRKQVNTGVIEWVDMSGKWGITPSHATAYGGVSGSSGGGRGWQLRNSWYDVEAGVGGPSEGGISVGFHIVDDYKENNPAGHRYGTIGDAGYLGSNYAERWGLRGGNGGVLYAGRWYECETDRKSTRLNSSHLISY